MRISLTERQFEKLLWCVFSEDYYNLKNEFENEDIKFVKKFIKYTKKLGYEDVIEEITSFKLGKSEEDEEEKEELKRKQQNIFDENGIFRCPKCDIRTNEKTYETKCIICNTSLLRVGDN